MNRTLGAISGAFALAMALVAAPLGGQQVTAPSQVTIADGNSTVISMAGGLSRVSIADPEIADAVVVSETEVVVNAKSPGTTSLLVWSDGTLHTYQVRVTADAGLLEEQLGLLFPTSDIAVSAMGNTVILSGGITNGQVRDKAIQLAESLGEDVTVVDQLSVPEVGQVMLKVRFAEVGRNALEEYGINVTRVDPYRPRLDDELGVSSGGAVPFSRDFMGLDGPEQTFSDAVNFFLFHDSSNFGAFIQALRGRGLFRSLAEPNLIAIPGEEASFLAGGEFPFPVLQAGSNSNAVTIQFKEFGIRLSFTPEIRNNGAIRLNVAPEVSSLDFANGLQLAGFRIPSLTSRKAETVIELRDGQSFAIAGLVDNTLIEGLNKVPLLGDIPVLGRLFQSKELRQNNTELLVIVTPTIVFPQDVAPEVPTGEPEAWIDWSLFPGDAETTTGTGGSN